MRKTAFVLVVLWATPARAFDPGAFVETRPIAGVGEPGLYRVEVDPTLYQHSRAEVDPLDDLRIAGPDGAEVPFLVRPLASPSPEAAVPATMVDPVTLPDGSLRAVLDLGQPGRRHTEVRLSLDGEDFLRRTRIEVSADEAEWARIAEGQIVYRIQAASLPASNTILTYPPSDARYLRVTLLPGSGTVARIAGATVVNAPAASRPPTRTLPLHAETSVTPPQKGMSFFVFAVDAPGVPLSTLTLDVGTPTFERRARVSATSHSTYWIPVGGGLLYRTVPTPSGGEASQPSDLTLSVGGSRKRAFRLEIQDGDDAPLEIRGVEGTYRAHEIVFRATSPGPHVLYVGAPRVPPPSYDLAAVLARSGEPTLRPASFGEIAPNPHHGEHGDISTKPWTERHAPWIATVVAALVLGLAFITLRLLRRQA